jgi:hypothetical protein
MESLQLLVHDHIPYIDDISFHTYSLPAYGVIGDKNHQCVKLSHILLTPTTTPYRGNGKI